MNKLRNVTQAPYSWSVTEVHNLRSLKKMLISFYSYFYYRRYSKGISVARTAKIRLRNMTIKKGGTECIYR